MSCSSRMVNLSLRYQLGGVITEVAKYMSRQLFEDKDLTMIFVRFDTSICTNQNQKNHNYSKIILDISNQDDAIVSFES